MAKPEKKIGQEFQCIINYNLPLPPLPFEPKLLRPNFDSERHYKDVFGSIHTTTPLEIYGRDNENGMNTSPLSLGLLWRKEPFVNQRHLLDPADQQLLAPYQEVKEAHTQVARPVVPWLRRNEYLGSDVQLGVGKVDVNSRIAEKKTLQSPPKKFAGLSNREAFMKTIDGTFEIAAKAHVSTLKHPTNPNLKAEEILPVFPDFEKWANTYSLAVFDADPIHSQFDKSLHEEDDLFKVPLEEALLKPLMNPKNPNDRFISYYAPNNAAVGKILKKRTYGELEEEDDEGYDYAHVRDFNFKMEASENDNPIMCLEIRRDDGAAFFTRLNSRMTMSRKRALSKAQRRYEEEVEKPTMYHVKFRKYTKAEKSSRRAKLGEVLKKGEFVEDDDKEQL